MTTTIEKKEFNLKWQWNSFRYEFTEQPFFERVLTTLFYGDRSAGKSLHQAKTAAAIFDYLGWLYKVFPDIPQAIVVSNQLFSQEYRDAYEIKKWDTENQRYIPLVPKVAPRLFQWESLQQLQYCPRLICWKGQARHRMHDAYFIFDDISVIIPPEGWQLLPIWFRKMLFQAGHNGIHTIANLQDPAACDINFRRNVDLAVKVTKLWGSRRPEEAKPPVRWIYGQYETRAVTASDLFKKGEMTDAEIERYLEEHPEMRGQKYVTRRHWIWRRDTEIYDTLQNVPEYMPGMLEHIESKCQDPNCDYVHVRHRAIG